MYDKNEENNVEEYLQFVRYVMQEKSISRQDTLVMGASGYEEEALKLLEKLKYDYDMAKLHILYLTMVILHEDKIKKMTNQEIKDIVDSAVQGLCKVKQDEKERIIKNLDNMFSREDSEPLDITVVSNLLDKNNMELPQRFYGYCNEAKEFSKTIFRKIKQRLKLNEIIILHNKSK